MNNIQRKEKDFQKRKSTETKQTFFSRITNTFNRSSKLNFAGRKRFLAIFHREKDKLQDKELESFFIEVESIFFDKHLKLTVGSIREKYQITGRASQKDFYRICEGENITVVNSLPDSRAKALEKYGCYFIVPDLEEKYFLSFDEQLKGKERLECQFQLLGNHFLHRAELPTASQAFDNSETNHTQKEEAQLFAIYFVDFKRVEVENA